MNLIVRGVNYTPSEETKKFLDKKIQKLSFAEEYIHDLELVMTRLTVGQGYHVDSHLHLHGELERLLAWTVMSYMMEYWHLLIKLPRLFEEKKVKLLIIKVRIL